MKARLCRALPATRSLYAVKYPAAAGGIDRHASFPRCEVFSPSKGCVNLTPPRFARYEAGGAAAISVLTEQRRLQRLATRRSPP